jgi:hypothetical protein
LKTAVLSLSLGLLLLLGKGGKLSFLLLTKQQLVQGRGGGGCRSLSSCGKKLSQLQIFLDFAMLLN